MTGRESALIAKILNKTAAQILAKAISAHKASHAVGGSDSVFPADPNADKFLKWDDGESALVWADAGGAFAGTMDDITDGSTYVKTENNYSDDDKSKLDGLTGGLTSAQVLTIGLL